MSALFERSLNTTLERIMLRNLKWNTNSSNNNNNNNNNSSSNNNSSNNSNNNSNNNEDEKNNTKMIFNQIDVEYPIKSERLYLNPSYLNNLYNHQNNDDNDVVVNDDEDCVDNNTRNHSIIERVPCRLIRMEDIFHREDERLKTFELWPLEWIDKHALARTGMFYTGIDDKVKCYFCEVEIGRWERNDDPVLEHYRWFPSCPLLRRRTTNNLPIDDDAFKRSLPETGYDICGANDAVENRSVATTSTLTDETTTITNMNSIASGQQSINGCGSGEQPTCSTNTAFNTPYYPEYPEYAHENARLRSFTDWPKHLKQKPEQLAEAGFFYTGKDDRVKCFSCGGGLKDWAEDDDPWEQHNRWMSKCRYLNLMRDIVVNTATGRTKTTKPNNNTETLTMDQTTNNSNNNNTNNNNNNNNTLSGNKSATTTTTAAEAGAAMTNKTCGNNSINAVNKKTTTNDIGEAKEEGIKTDTTKSTVILEEKACKICYAEEYNTIFVPCGHVVACAKCASSVTKCPLCRKPFTDIMRVFFS